MNLALKAALPAALTFKRSLVLLAPAQAPVPYAFTAAASDKEGYETLLGKMQRFRGAIYVQDGAIGREDLDSEGRHRLETDVHSWHVVALNGQGDVCGCSRYTSYDRSIDFKDLAVGRSALARSDIWGGKLRAAVEREKRVAAREETSFVEVGGWAISENLRRTTEALRIALSTYALAQCLGGCIGLTTATARHHSADVLRKIGGRPLVMEASELPPYFDPQYGCEMQVLRFDSAAPNPKFRRWIEQIKSDMTTTEVLSARADVRPAARRLSQSGEDCGLSMSLPLAWQFS